MNKKILVSVPKINVSGILRQKASLPCDITPSRKDDAVHMVLWFKGEQPEPIYRWVSIRVKIYDVPCVRWQTRFPLNQLFVAKLYDRALVGSFDVRNPSSNDFKLWSSPRVFDKRAIFNTSSKPAALHVGNIQLSDEAIYRCRVDFKNSPTRNIEINFSVIGKSVIFLVQKTWNEKIGNTLGVFRVLKERYRDVGDFSKKEKKNPSR